LDSQNACILGNYAKGVTGFVSGGNCGAIPKRNDARLGSRAAQNFGFLWGVRYFLGTAHQGQRQPISDREQDNNTEQQQAKQDDLTKKFVRDD